MMKKTIVIIIFIAISSFAFAQNNYQDVVYLKNGSIIRGVIIEQVPNKSIKIETSDMSVFVYQMDDIEKFTKEPIKAKIKNSNNSFEFKSGYQEIVEMGAAIGIGDNAAGLISVCP